MKRVLLVMSIGLLVGGCAFPFGDGVKDVVKTTIKAGATVKIAGDVEKTIKGISDNKTQRIKLETDVQQSEIVHDGETNEMLYKAILSIPVKERIPLIEHALELRGKDIKADLGKAEARGDRQFYRGILLALISIVGIWLFKYVLDKVWRTPRKVSREY